MSLLTLCHLSVTSPIQSSSNQTAAVAAQAAREAERDEDRDARRDLVLVSWYVLLTFVQILFFYKRKQTRSRWMLEFFSGAAMLKTRGKENAARGQDRRAGQPSEVDEQQPSGLNE
jgi:hypothetical protein